MAKKKTAKKSTPKAAKKATKTAKAAPSRKSAPKKAAKRAASSAPAKVSRAKKAPAKATPARRTSRSSEKKMPKTPLSKRELANFRKLLVEKRRSLIGDLVGMEGSALGRGMQDGTGDLSNMPTHPADVGSDNFEHEFTLGLMESERQLLQEIEQALERIDNSTYGICVGTGEPIGIARLTARPWCKYCIEYQRLIEKGLVRPSEDDEFGDDGDDEDPLDDDDDEDDDDADSSDDSESESYDDDDD